MPLGRRPAPAGRASAGGNGGVRRAVLGHGGAFFPAIHFISTAASAMPGKTLCVGKASQGLTAVPGGR